MEGNDEGKKKKCMQIKGRKGQEDRTEVHILQEIRLLDLEVPQTSWMRTHRTELGNQKN